MKIIEKKAVTLDLPVFKDENGDVYEPTGEFRPVQKGEYFKFSNETVCNWAVNDLPYERHIYKKRRWRAERGGKYFAVHFRMHENRFEVSGIIDFDCLGAKNLYSMGNYYETEQEAREVADKLNKEIAPQILEVFK